MVESYYSQLTKLKVRAGKLIFIFSKWRAGKLPKWTWPVANGAIFDCDSKEQDKNKYYFPPKGHH